jgi:large subunit ribosomal protein L22
MSAEQETTGPAPQDDVTEPATPAAKKPAAKKAARKPAKAAKGAEAKAAGKDAEAKADEGKKPAAKKAAKKPAAKKAASKEPAAKEPVASESKKTSRGKAPDKPRRKVVRAHARYVRTSARKARMVCGHLRGKSVQEARAILAFTPRDVARDWSKLLESAVANAESNHELLEDDLIVREAFADEGPTIKRFRPRAMGRATPIRKRTSHLTITLTPRPEPGASKKHG